MVWILPHSFVVVYDHFTYSLQFSSIHYKGARGRECGLIPRELIALSGKIGVSTYSLNIVNISSAWVLKMLA